MAKKKRIPSWKVVIYSGLGICVFLITSTLFDIIQGDTTPGRILTLKISIVFLFAIGLITGSHKIIQAVKKGVGM